MIRKSLFICLAFIGLVACNSLRLGAQTVAAPETIELKPESFVVVDSLDARIESRKTSTLKVEPKSWSVFKVKEIVPQGTLVKKGDNILTFESQDIETKMHELKYELDLARLGLDDAKAELDFYMQTSPMDKELAERNWAQVQDDTKYYFETQKPLAERQAKRGLESSQYSLEYAQEELDQLLKMYNADELTEDSEKIVLKRAERSLDQSKFFLEMSQINTQRQLGVEIPRVAKEKEFALERGRLEHEKKSVEFPRMMQRKELEYAKLKFTFEKKEKEFNELLRDADLMALNAPMDGVVYHGQARRGNWVKGGTTAYRMIEAGDAIAANAAILTIVDLGSLQLRCDLDQKQKMNVKKGAKVFAMFDDRPSVKVEGAVTDVGQYPIDDGKYDCIVQLSAVPEGIVPGMNCKIKYVSYKNDKALFVPKTSVFTDDGGLTQYVYVLVGDKPERRSVSAPRENGDRLEVTEGLKAGEKVLKAKPQ